MGFKCGIIGLPNVGKSTLFNALTCAGIDAENFPFCTIEPNTGVVPVPDTRLEDLANIVRPEKVIPATMEFVDIAGLVAGASKGEGLGNKFLANIRETEAEAHVVRCFEDEEVVHVAGKVSPKEDIETINTELALADLETIEKITNPKTNDPYSSTDIRECIRTGEIEEANLLLGRPWSMQGKVIHGDKRARKMNFPTANILPHNEIYPLKGVYAVNIKFADEIHKGIANFGIRPTVAGEKLLLEAHLFDFDRDIYGNYLTVEFLAFIRGEKKFETFDYLVEQINKDIQIAKDYHLRK